MGTIDINGHGSYTVAESKEIFRSDWVRINEVAQVKFESGP